MNPQINNLFLSTVVEVRHSPAQLRMKIIFTSLAEYHNVIPEVVSSLGVEKVAAKSR